VSEDLVQYIREHRATYTREALTAEMVAAGHDAAEVAAAWAQLEVEDAAAAPALPTGWVTADTRPYVRGASTYLAMLIVVLGYAGSVVFFLVASGTRYNGVAILYALAMVAAGAFVLRRMLGASRAGVVAGSFLIAVLLYIALAGACIVGVVNVGVL
jgi:hypothetical protein